MTIMNMVGGGDSSLDITEYTMTARNVSKTGSDNFPMFRSSYTFTPTSGSSVSLYGIISNSIITTLQKGNDYTAICNLSYGAKSSYNPYGIRPSDSDDTEVFTTIQAESMPTFTNGTTGVFNCVPGTYQLGKSYRDYISRSVNDGTIPVPFVYSNDNLICDFTELKKLTLGNFKTNDRLWATNNSTTYLVAYVSTIQYTVST